MRYTNHYNGAGYYASQMNVGENRLYTFSLGTDEEVAERLAAQMGLGTVFKCSSAKDMPSFTDELTGCQKENLSSAIRGRG